MVWVDAETELIGGYASFGGQDLVGQASSFSVYAFAMEEQLSPSSRARPFRGRVPASWLPKSARSVICSAASIGTGQDRRLSASARSRQSRTQAFPRPVQARN